MTKFMSGERRATILLVVIITVIIAIMTLCRREVLSDSDIILTTPVIESTQDTTEPYEPIELEKSKKPNKSKTKKDKKTRPAGHQRSHLDEDIEAIE